VINLGVIIHLTLTFDLESSAQFVLPSDTVLLFLIIIKNGLYSPSITFFGDLTGVPFIHTLLLLLFICLFIFVFLPMDVLLLCLRWRRRDHVVTRLSLRWFSSRETSVIKRKL